MCKITRIKPDSSQQGNPTALLWVDNMDVSREYDAIRINFKSQILYLLTRGIGGEIELKKNGTYTNVTVPFEMEEKLKNNKAVNNVFDLMFDSIVSLKNGGSTVISDEELKSEVSKYTSERNIIRDQILEDAKKDSVLKSVLAPLLKLDDEKIKTSDRVLAQTSLNELTNIYERNILTRNNLKVAIGE